MENNMESVFAGAAMAGDASVETNAKAEEKKIKTAMAQSFKVKVASDPEFAKIVNSASGSLSVESVYKYGATGNIKVNKEAETRELVACGKPVGYAVKNIGSTPIAYTTEEFAAGADGIYVGTVVNKTIAPGETVMITRKYLAMLVSRPEFGMKLANGSVITSAVKAKSTDQILSQSYFNFKADSGKTVNDDDVSIRIDNEGKVTDEFITVFGNLNNPKQAKTKKSGSKDGVKYTAQDYVANYIQEMLAQGGQV